MRTLVLPVALSIAIVLLGARFQRYLGVEAEVTVGVADQTFAGVETISLDSQYAGYVMGFLSVQPNTDLFAWVGYGIAKLKVSGVVAGNRERRRLELRRRQPIFPRCQEQRAR